MPCGEIWAEMMCLCGQRMSYGNVIIALVACQFRCHEKQLEVHHVINDNREVPFSKVPGTNTAYLFIKTRSKIFGCLNDNAFYSVVGSKAKCIPIAAIYHEPQVVGSFIVTHGIKFLGIGNSLLLQLVTVRKGIGIPKTAGKEATCPVIDIAETQCFSL